MSAATRHIAASLALIAITACQAMAQSQPATIPTLVAQAMTFQPALFGRPEFFDGRTPPDWPAALIPEGAKVLGSGMFGDSAMFRMRVAVFDFARQPNPRGAIEALVKRAGYGQPAPRSPLAGIGGFAETPATQPAGRYCNGSTLATFGLVDSLGAPTVYAVWLLDGESGRQSCKVQSDAGFSRREPVTLPPLRAPAGAASTGSGSSWSGSTGQVRTTLRTTMPADSLLSYYTTQLVAAGWKTEGRSATAEGVALQRFSFRQGQEDWDAAFVVFAVAEQRELVMHLSKHE